MAIVTEDTTTKFGLPKLCFRHNTCSQLPLYVRIAPDILVDVKENPDIQFIELAQKHSVSLGTVHQSLVYIINESEDMPNDIRQILFNRYARPDKSRRYEAMIPYFIEMLEKYPEIGVNSMARKLKEEKGITVDQRTLAKTREIIRKMD